MTTPTDLGRVDIIEKSPPAGVVASQQIERNQGADPVASPDVARERWGRVGLWLAGTLRSSPMENARKNGSGTGSCCYPIV